jgi:ABC-2 type transport system permease protein
VIATLARIRFAEVLAWRTEFLLWLMTLTMPLIMLAMWRAVTRDGAFGGYTSSDITAYFLGVLAVVLITECNLVWNLNEDLRTGELSFWLLKPAHPLVNYAAITLAEIPARLAVAAPIVAVALWQSPGGAPMAQRLPCFVLALLLGLGINQAVQVMIGALGFWIHRSLMVFKLYETVGSVLSGYLVPLSFLPAAIAGVAAYLPFRFVLSLPVEFLLGRHDAAAAAYWLAVQALMFVALNALALWTWQRGVRRYAAYG